ncbi:MAG TPA: PQQ-binding-like beta-propeller repeat protein [Candidatus Acidoferrales bacterium]|nr:PQQ-binding-like beta-propeller repeat protein [Candidatus Acidoferrales bacterium]
MSRRAFDSIRAVIALSVGLAAAAIGVAAQTSAHSTKNGEWPSYAADLASTRYSPLDQINANNFDKLEVAWHFKTDNLGTRPEYKLEGTPLMVNGMLYATGGTRRSVVALKADTGELVWVHAEFEGARAANAPRQLSGRGLAFWSDGKGDDRILYVTTGYRLIALNAKTGALVNSFGTNGVVDLKVGAVYGTGQQIDLEKGEIGVHSTPIVAGNTVLVGSAMREGFTIKTHNNTKGLVRAFDARTGKLLWKFHTIPRPGEFGNDTWLDNSWAVNGNAGVWTQMSVDEQLGLAYLPVEDPSSDFYGGHRPGNDLFGDSIVCVDLKTGQRKWFYQVVHHPMWDYDLSSAPILADINVDGRAIKAVAVPSKESFLYVFDRVTGKPVWPIEERPVPKGDVPGEWYSPTQPFPTKPPAYARQAVTDEDLIDFTPEMRAKALEIMKMYKMGPMFNPAVASNASGPLAAITIGTAAGGTNWPGAGYDPETHVVFAPASNSSVMPISLVKPPKEFGTDMNYVYGRDDQPFRFVLGPGEGSAADAARTPAVAPPPPPPSRPAAGGGNSYALIVQGMPIVKPPYGLLSAIDLDKGDIVWQVPHGDTPDVVRNNPALKGMDIPKTGQGGNVGLVVTKSLVIMGDPSVTTAPDHPRGAMLRAYDKATGKQVGAVYLPAPQSGSPMTYMVNGKQYIVVAVSGGSYSGDYIAFALPSNN